MGLCSCKPRIHRHVAHTSPTVVFNIICMYRGILTVSACLVLPAGAHVARDGLLSRMDLEATGSTRVVCHAGCKTACIWYYLLTLLGTILLPYGNVSPNVYK